MPGCDRATARLTPTWKVFFGKYWVYSANGIVWGWCAQIVASALGVSWICWKTNKSITSLSVGFFPHYAGRLWDSKSGCPYMKEPRRLNISIVQKVGPAHGAS